MESSLMQRLLQTQSKRTRTIPVNLIPLWMSWVPCLHLMVLIIMEQRSCTVEFLAPSWPARFSLDLFITNVFVIWSRTNFRWAIVVCSIEHMSLCVDVANSWAQVYYTDKMKKKRKLYLISEPESFYCSCLSAIIVSLASCVDSHWYGVFL